MICIEGSHNATNDTQSLHQVLLKYNVCNVKMDEILEEKADDQNNEIEDDTDCCTDTARSCPGETDQHSNFISKHIICAHTRLRIIYIILHNI